MFLFNKGYKMDWMLDCVVLSITGIDRYLEMILWQNFFLADICIVIFLIG